MWKLTLGYWIIFTTLGEIIQIIVPLLLHVESLYIYIYNFFNFGLKWRESIVGEKTPVQKFWLTQIPQ
jgi:hypothetical protein